MKKDNEQLTSFTRRAVIIGALQGSCLAILGGRLAWLQIAQGQKYKTLAENNRINLKMLAPSRGRLVDRFGVPLAVNDQSFRVLIVPEQAGDLEKVLSRLQKLIELSQRDIKKTMKLAEKQADFVPLEVKNNLEWEDVARIEVNLPDLPGLSIDAGEIRTYPLGEATAHLVGYVGAVSSSELTGDPVLTLPGFKIGKTGIEKFYDKGLRGTAGTAEVEVNVVGREVRELKRRPGNPGKKISLTIDSELQIYMQKRLEMEQSASAVLMDVHTGAVYALTSSPSFDPNLFTRGLSAEIWEEMLANPGLPLNNKAVGGLYPPGSTFKMVTAMAGLEEGKISQNTSVFCPGHYDYSGDRFHCWKRGGHGRVDLVEALAQSCDTFFYKMATDVGIDKISEYANKLGMGQTLGFELPEERPGLMPTKAWKMGHFGTGWQPGETIVSSIGQGFLQATPLQLAVMTSRLVNGGYEVKPWITNSIDDLSGRERVWRKLDFKKSNIALIIKGMDKVVGSLRGTANAAQIQKEGFEMGGKTGTAQVRRISMADRLEGVQNSELPWKFRHHALFVGYAPVSSPRYACTVVVEHGSSGSATAAPIARDLLLKVQERALTEMKDGTKK
ncbi:MAG: penicillin-binding protein 2 [Alphaproteobacteria bacterium CG_4_9_14_3_um_filter_47_13]|nr:MAG: penicillin-binding protein 2 [Alphaproteobacteria bacterium CG_4_9_14_3_um_filter_47_13]